MTAPGTLLLVPSTLDLGSGQLTPLEQVLPAAVQARAAGLQHWVVEEAKAARAFLKRVGTTLPLQALHIVELPRATKGGHGPVPDMAPLLQPLLQGHDLGLLSDAGMPAVADPGAALVAAAHARGLTVQPLVGPSALLLALAGSGLNGQSFAFVGYLPVDAAQRAQRLRDLEQRSRKERQTQLAIETPYRNQALLGALLQYLQPGTRLCVAVGLTLEGGWCRTRPVAQWRQAPPTLGERLPAVFAFLA